MFVAASVGAAFIALSLGLSGWMALVAAVCGGCVAFAVPALSPRPEPGRLDVILGWACVGLAATWVLVLFNAGLALPPGDPIAVPQFAQTIADGSLLTKAYPAGSSAHAYPPGYPILLAPATVLLSPLNTLVLFKMLTLACVVLIPAAWAWLHIRLFKPEAPAWVCMGLAYAAFFVAERTLGFVTPFAGKNALLVGLLLYPAVTLAVLSLARDARRWPLAVAPVYGLALIHYTMLHLAAAFLGALVVTGLVQDRQRWREFLRVLAAGAGAVGLLVLFNHEALSDTRAGGVIWRPMEGLAGLVRLMTAQRPGFVPFMDQDFGLAASPYRGLLLIACAAFALWAGRFAKQPRLGEAAIVYLLAFLASLAFAVGLVPAGITLDFVRWFAWPLQVAIFLCAGLAAFALWSPMQGKTRLAGIGLGVVAGCGALAILYGDGRIERGLFMQTVVGHRDLARVDAALPDQLPAGGCFLIGDSLVQPGGDVMVQRSRAWSYAETISPCLYLNGSWVQPGHAGGRAEGGLPSAESLRRLSPRAEVYFVGGRDALTRYAKRMAQQGVAWSWRSVGQVSPGTDVWRRTAS